MQSAAVDHAADQWIASQSAVAGEPLTTRVQADPSLSPVEKAVVRLKLDFSDSVRQSQRAATVKAADDRFGTASQALATGADYRRGDLTGIAKAYADADENGKAAAIQGVADHEPMLLAFAQLSADEQKAAIEAVPEEARSAAESMRREQEATFANAARRAVYRRRRRPAGRRRLRPSRPDASPLLPCADPDLVPDPDTASVEEINVERVNFARAYVDYKRRHGDLVTFAQGRQ